MSRTSSSLLKFCSFTPAIQYPYSVAPLLSFLLLPCLCRLLIIPLKLLPALERKLDFSCGHITWFKALTWYALFWLISSTCHVDDYDKWWFLLLPCLCRPSCCPACAGPLAALLVQAAHRSSQLVACLFEDSDKWCAFLVLHHHLLESLIFVTRELIVPMRLFTLYLRRSVLW